MKRLRILTMPGLLGALLLFGCSDSTIPANVGDDGIVHEKDMGSEGGMDADSGEKMGGIASIAVEPSAAEIEIDQTETLTATALDADGNRIAGVLFEWSSSAPEIAEVTDAGIVIAKREGFAVITAEARGIEGVAEVTVVGSPVSDIEIVPMQRTLDVGETVSITVSLFDASGAPIDEMEREVTFESADLDVVSVDNSGLVTGVGPGETTVTVTAESLSATAMFTVTGPEIERIEITPLSATLVPGDTTQLMIDIVWRDGDEGTPPDVSWNSSDDAVAAVDAGLVTAKSEGSATITASAGMSSVSAMIDVTMDFDAISAGGSHTCGLVRKVAFCWGDNAAGQLGHSLGAAPARVETALTFESVSAGGSHTCGVATDGHAYCWGDNTYGQLGNGSNQASSSPVRVGMNLQFTNVAAGVHHSCGVDSTGQLWCWGRGDDGRLGDGFTMDRNAPAAVGTFARVFPGERHTCAVDTMLVGYCWGDNDNGQLGLDLTSDYEPTPEPVTGGFGFSNFAPGNSHTCGLTSSGAAACWGLNDSGQVGDASNIQRVTPILMPVMFQLGRLTSGDFHSCGLTGAGDAYCWGEGADGRLGTGQTDDVNEAAAVDTTLQFGAIDAGVDFTCAISDGDVYCWGAGGSGQLGPSSTGSHVPVTVF